MGVGWDSSIDANWDINIDAKVVRYQHVYPKYFHIFGKTNAAIHLGFQKKSLQIPCFTIISKFMDVKYSIVLNLEPQREINSYMINFFVNIYSAYKTAKM